MQTDLGIIVTNRDRPEPLDACLRALAAQTAWPAWVVIADLGSSPQGGAALEEIADCFFISYLQIDYPQRWNQGLAFNTALRAMPWAKHVIQLDADFILHPHLLDFTQRALQRVNAMCCVPSYVDVSLVPREYDGSAVSFGRLLSNAYGGNRLSRGGYVAYPRDWLLANRAFDEAYVGWGFEDADLWWRAEQALITYEELSGSLAIHQSHERQPGVADQSGNPNWKRYEQRTSGVELIVNPQQFGAAPIRRRVIRNGICSLPAMNPRTELEPRYTPRTRQGERLRPAPSAETHPYEEISFSRVEEMVRACTQPGETGGPQRSVSVVMILDETSPDVIRAAMNSLLVQTLSPTTVSVVDVAGLGDTAWLDAEYAHRFEYWKHVRVIDKHTALVQILQEISSSVPVLAAYRLVVTGLVLNPQMLEILSCIQQYEPYPLRGPVHTLPPIASEMSLLSGAPWQAWASIAHVESEPMGGWFFYPESLEVAGNLPSQFATLLGGDCKDAGGQSEQLSGDGFRRTPSELVLCLRCARKANLPGIYG